MSEGQTYELPAYFQSEQSPNRFLDLVKSITSSESQRNTDKRTREKQFIENIRNKMSTKDAEALAISSAFGEITLPHVILPDLTKQNIKDFWGYSDDKRIAALYTLMCSSLYYEVLGGKVSVAKGKKIAGMLYDLFKDAKLVQEKNYFSTTFTNAIKEGAAQRQMNIPEELVDILDYPLLLKEQFGHFFTRLRNQKKQKGLNSL